MEKRSSYSSYGERVKEALPEFVEIELREPEKPPSKPLVLMTDIGTLNINGAVTGTKYTWHGAGSIVDVDMRDVPTMLSKVRGNSCCGASHAPYFTVLT